MTEHPQHLKEQVVQYLELPLAERIERIRSPRWIGYSRAQEILTKLEELYSHPPSHRMPNMLLVGDTNNGKTMLIRRFCSKHEASDNPGADAVSVPVLYVQAPPTPDESRFYSAILNLLFAPYRQRDRLEKKQDMVITLLRQVGMRVLVIDEIQHILAGSMHKQRTFLNVIKYLGNELQVPIVAVGTLDAFRAVQSDPQLANRFEPLPLPRWDLNEEFLRLLVSFERMLPLREPSVLPTPALAAKLLSMSDGLIGELAQILTSAAIHAVKSGKERIDIKILESIGWVSPSERKRQML